MDLLEYNASLIWNLVPFIALCFLFRSIQLKFAIPDMVHTLTFVNVKPRKYLLSRIIACGCIVSNTYISLIHLHMNFRYN